MIVSALLRSRTGGGRSRWRGLLPLLGGAALAFGACDDAVEVVSISSDRTAPAVRSVSPAGGSTDVPTDTPVEVVFSEDIDGATVTVARFAVTADGTALIGLVRAGSDGARFAFVPADSLLPVQSSIEVTIGAGIADPAGNQLGAPFTWSFVTGGDTPVPGTPTLPDPVNGAQGIAIDTLLSWSVVDGAGDSWDVRLGPAGDELEPVASGLGERHFLAGPLAYDTEYEWRIVTHLGAEVREGPVWRFTTGPDPDPSNTAPPAPSEPVPADGGTATPDANLRWTDGGDADGDPVAFEVYLGIDDDPPRVATVGQPLYDPPADLEPNVEYRWRVIADDGRGGRAGSPLWAFDTGEPNGPPGAPASPFPADGATGVAPDATLTWDPSVDPDGDPVVYDVHFGTDSPPPLVSENQTQASHVPPADLMAGTLYHWQIVAKDDHEHAVPGPEWSFTINGPPAAPCDPEPAHNSVDVSVDAVLRWSCATDPEGDDLEFDVYFAASNSEPPLVATVIDTFYAPDAPAPRRLEYNTPYFWRIVARDSRGAEQSGPTWFFQTGQPPNQPPSAPSDPVPADSSTVSQLLVTFSWRCSIDPEGDTVTYDFRVGRTPDPPLFGRDLSACTFGPVGVTAGDWFWRVDASDGSSTTVGKVWSFTVATADVDDGDGPPPAAGR